MTDLERNIRQVWNPDVRSLAEEAWRCYSVGAIRASIAITWTAITEDIITKIVWLANEGDSAAAEFQKKVEQARNCGISSDGVRAMQKIEDSLLDNAESLELIDSIDKRELERIRQDRNLCVHPSLRSLGEVYEPRPEVARGHLAVALSALLIHPPTQGRRVVDDFTAHICDPNFVPVTTYIQSNFFDRVRSTVRKNIIQIAAKHAVLEISPSPEIRLDPTEIANRMAKALNAFALRDRRAVSDAMAKISPRFQTANSEIQLRALARLGNQDFFWELVDQALAERLGKLLSTLACATPYDQLPANSIAHIALVRFDNVRQRLPILENIFAKLDIFSKMSIVATHPDPYFVPTVINLLQQAFNFRIGKEVGEILLQYARFLTKEDLQSALENWKSNYECRQSFGMPQIAVRLFHATAFLGESRREIFFNFINRIRELDPDGPNSYSELEATLQSTHA